MANRNTKILPSLCQFQVNCLFTNLRILEPQYTFREGYGTSEEDKNMVDAVCILCTFASSHCHKKIIHQMWGGQEFQFLGPWCPRQKPCCCIDATPTWISATTYQSKYCHPMRSCFLLFPEFFFKFPFLSYLAQLPSTKSSSKLSSTMWHSSVANFGILFDHWRLNKMVTRIVNSTVGTFQKCFRTLESWWFLKSLSSPVASLVLLPPEAAALSKPEERFNQDLLM